ncbi:MAG: molecular chaperone DnaJ [Candidatus Paceibacterota bacterium]
MKDYYKILGVDRNASQEEIRKAFHKLAHQYHPDKGGDPEKFKEINEAYQILSDPVKRAQYDRYGQVFEGVGAQREGFSDFSWQGVNFEAPFDFSFQGDLFDLFSDFFGSSYKKRKTKRENKGKDLEVDLEITLEEAAFGAEKEISFRTYVKCEKCHGSGYEPGSKEKTCRECKGEGVIRQVQRTILGSFTQIKECPKCKGRGKIPEKPCSHCGGDGRIYDLKKVKVSIPAGIRNREVIRIQNEGEAGWLGAPSGDLYVKIHILPHPVFERKGDDLYTSVYISFKDAVLGTKKEIKTLDGKKIMLKIPPGTNSGEIFRVRGKGIKHFNATGYGDLYVTVKIETPKKVSSKAKKLLEELDKELKENS